MSEAQPAQQGHDDGDEQDDNDAAGDRDFFEAMREEGVTIDGDFYCTTGTGRSTRYHRYDPADVNGLDAVRGDDGDIVAQEVAGHEEAVEETINKGDLMSVASKFEDGFGVRGPASVTKATRSASGPETDYEPMDADEVLDTIRENFDETGLFAEDDDGDNKVVSLAHPEARLMGYITGSHVGALPAEALETVDDYRRAVFEALVAGDHETELELGSPDEVPIAPEETMEKFREAGGDVDEDTREKISQQVQQRWEDGDYDHLRNDEEDDGQDAESGGDEADDGGE